MKRINLQFKSKFTDSSKIVRNRFVDFYLDSFERRIKNHDKLYLSYLLIITYLIFIVKNLICLFCDLDFHTRLMLYDISHMIGGIPEYNQTFMTLSITLNVVIAYKFHISSDTNIEDFILLLNLIRGKFKFIKLFLDRDNTLILNKVTRAASITYKFTTFMGTFICKYDEL